MSTDRLASLSLIAALVAAGCGKSAEAPTPPLPGGPPPDFGEPVSAAVPPPPLSGGTLRVLADGRTAIASDPDRDRIFVADLVAGKLLAEVAVPDGSEPGRSAVDGAGRVHVALRRGGEVVTLAQPGWLIVARRPVCAGPRGITYDATRALVHVACVGGELVSFDPDAPASAPIARKLILDGDLRDVVARGDRLYVTRFRAAELLVVDGDGRLEARQTPPARLSPRKISTPPPPGSTGSNIATMVARVAWRLVEEPSGGMLLLHQNALADEVSTEKGGYGGGNCGGVVETAVSRVNDSGLMGKGVLVAGATLTVDIAAAPDGRVALVAAGNAHTPGLSQIRVLHSQAMDGTDCVDGEGRRPAGDAGALDGQTPDGGPDVDEVPPVMAVVQPAGEAVAVAFMTRGHLVVQTREPASLQIVTGGRTIRLSSQTRKDVGHAVFHSNSGVGLACASCHPDGGDDGHVWRFAGVGPRRTQSLRGGIGATAPFHWNGDLRDLGALMNEVFVQRMAGPRVGAAPLAGLAHWLDAVPHLPHGAPSDGPAVARGQTLFTSARLGCAGCHSGPSFTNNQTVDVGTGRPLQVPSLRGLLFRAPYMHDGCAPDLAARFRPDCGGGDKHGNASTLTAPERADLSAFLETL